MPSFIPEKPLLIFPSLAATLGLEEATLLSLLDSMTQNTQGETSRGYDWYMLTQSTIEANIPFWDALDIQRVSQRLRDLGIILITSPPYAQSHELRFAFNERAITALHSSATPSGNRQATIQSNRHLDQGATLLSANWQPDTDTLNTLAQINIPEHFIRDRLPEFVHYWRERAESHRTWGAKFVQHIKRQWTHHVAKTSSAIPLPSKWQPSDELQQQISAEGIPSTFVQKSLHRFSLYHKNSGAKHANWDMPFFSWLKDDWDKQDAPYLEKKTSTAMIPEWRPDKHTLTFLTVSHGIELSFIEECIPEFIHKWIEKKAIYSEWGTVFAEHIIQQWRFVQAGVTRNPHPQIISPSWTPSHDCIELLCVHSGIDKQFIKDQTAEFILYWTNRAQPMHSWDNIFLRHVKHQWKQHYERQQTTSGSGRTKDRSLIDDLTDTSWAS